MKPNNCSELDIIFNLKSIGPDYLNGLYQTELVPSFKTLLVSYEKLYLTDEDLFENGVTSYIDFIIKHRTRCELWKHVINLFTEKQLCELITNFVKSSKKLNFSSKLKFLNYIFCDPKVKEILQNKSMWDCGVEFKNSLIGDLINTLHKKYYKKRVK